MSTLYEMKMHGGMRMTFAGRMGLYEISHSSDGYGWTARLVRDCPACFASGVLGRHVTKLEAQLLIAAMMQPQPSADPPKETE